jgi:hypothetical protein
MSMKRFAAFALSAALAMGLAAPLHAQVAMAAKPLGTATTNYDGITLDLMSVERKGSVLTVKWAVRNTGASQTNVSFGMTGRDQTTYILDEESGTKYYVLTDKEKNTLASEHEYLGSDTYGITEHIQPGASARFWAKFPAPPPAVKAINVFFTKTEPFEGIAITDK